MKKMVFYLVTICLFSVLTPENVKATVPDTINTEQVHAETKILINRLKEIEATDKTALSWKEKRELRREVRSIERKLREIGGTIYISVGALLIIILLLILLL